MEKALVILPYAPNKIRVRSFINLTELADLYEVDLIYLHDGKEEDIPSNVSRVVRIDNKSRSKRVLRVLYGLLRKRPITFQYYHAWELRRHLRNYDLSVYHIVFVERLPIHELAISHPNLVFDAVDCFATQVNLLKKHTRGWRKLLYAIDSVFIRPYETRVCNAASRILVTTEATKKALEKQGVTVNIVPHLHGLQFKPVSQPVVFERDHTLLSFHGKLTYRANLLALDVIKDSILPQFNTGVKLQVVGFVDEAVKQQYRCECWYTK